MNTIEKAIETKEIKQDYEQGVRKGFLAGIEFVYKMYPFLADTVEQRIKDDDFVGFEEVVSEDKENGCSEWNEDKWDNEVETEIKQIIQESK